MSSDNAHTGSLGHSELQQLADQLRANVEICDRRYLLKTYKKCFVGAEACEWMVKSGTASDYNQAQQLGQAMLDAGAFFHVLREHDFKNADLYYRFAEDFDHGKVPEAPTGDRASWFEFLENGWSRQDNESLLATLPYYGEEMPDMARVESWGVEPLDDYNAELLDNVHPKAWQDPEPKPIYNMVVIGAGSGGLVTAAAAAGLGARVALIEEHLLGGDCLNVGCVPSKALISAAKAAANVRSSGAYGVRIDGHDPAKIGDRISVDFGAVMDRLRRLRAKISHHDSADRFSRELGIDLFIGRGAFTGKDTIEVNGKTLRFAKACIATGGTPAVPNIPGLADAPYLTNQTLFNLTRLPARVAVMGTGAIGLEMAQSLRRFGAEVTVLARSGRILPKEDEDAAAIVQASMERDGVQFRFNCDYRSVSHEPAANPDDFPLIRLKLGDETLEVDALLVATGRKPNIEGLGLDLAGVDADAYAGISVNDRLQTSNDAVYAVGDVATRYQFTHVSDFMARQVIRNALFFGRDKFSDLLIPWATYTQPEVAHVGLYPKDMNKRGIEFTTVTREFADVDRAIVDGKTEGFVRVHLRAGSDEILGATVVHEHAGDLISELTLAIQSETGLGKLAAVIHPYPTMAEAIRQAGDLYNRTRLTPSVKKLFRGLMSIKR